MIYDLIDIGDFKKALKQINTNLEKGGKKMNNVEKMAYSLVKGYILDKSNKKIEALLEMELIAKDIVKENI